jgi:hypothetical protein
MPISSLGPRQRTILTAAAFVVAAGTSPVAGQTETECKSWFLGVCTSRFTPTEQAEINARKRLEALLRDDPAKAGPELERRLRKEVRYSNGLLLIDDPILHGVTTLPATAGWTISCNTLGVTVTFGATGENDAGTDVEIVPLGTTVDVNACDGISKVLGAAVLRLTSGQ